MSEIKNRGIKHLSDDAAAAAAAAAEAECPICAVRRHSMNAAYDCRQRPLCMLHLDPVTEVVAITACGIFFCFGIFKP
jgi:hypothetical protein